MERILDIILPAIPQTLVMVFASTAIALLIGMPLGVILTITRPGGLSESNSFYSFFIVLSSILSIL